MPATTLLPTVTAPNRPHLLNAPVTPGVAGEMDALVLRAQRGETEAFEQLYGCTVSRVYTLCLRMTGDPQRARELAHDTFVRAWETLASFRGQSTFASWIHRIAVNMVLQDTRSGRRRNARVGLADDFEQAIDAVAPGADPVTRLDLEAAIRRLSPDARRVVVLHDIEGYRHDEIASLLGVAPGTVRARLHHARKQLKEWVTR
jgi:RNA polymerase sigma-70 factor, ECF subfamily